MLFNAKLYFRLLHHSFFKARRTICPLNAERLGFLIGSATLGYAALEVTHRLAFLADTVLYPSSRKIEVSEPVFIISPNRSGTTLLVTLLAQDQRFTAPRLWEYFVALAVSERKAIWRIGKLAAKIGIPTQKILASIERSITSGKRNEPYDRVHHFSINGIEEDNIYLLHVSSGYDPMSMFPFPEIMLDYADYDRRIPPSRKKKDMAFLKSMIKKHVAAHGGKRYLSKMTTLSGAVPSILATFPDAKIIHLVRHPAKVVPSAMKLWMGLWIKHCCSGELTKLAPVILEQNRIWYTRLHEDTAHLPPNRYIRVAYEDVVLNMENTVRKIYEQFEIPLTDEFLAKVREMQEQERHYRSRNSYTLEEVGLSMEAIAEAFAEIAPAYGFTFPPDEKVL